MELQFHPDPSHMELQIRPDPACQQSTNLYDMYLLLCVQGKTPDDGQRNCPKHVQFHFQNKFEKLVHPVGVIVRMLRRILYMCVIANIHLMLGCWRYLYYVCTLFTLSFVNQCSLKIAIINSRNVLVESSVHVSQ